MIVWNLGKLATGAYGTRVVKKYRNTDTNTCFDGSSQIKTKKKNSIRVVSLNILYSFFPFSFFFSFLNNFWFSPLFSKSPRAVSYSFSTFRIFSIFFVAERLYFFKQRKHKTSFERIFEYSPSFAAFFLMPFKNRHVSSAR